MVIVRSGHGSPSTDDGLKAMFEDRKRVFVDLLRWDVPVLEDRFEIDEFDDSQATYLIVNDLAGDHLGSCRLLPTTRPHILGSLFSDLCASPPPTGPRVFEITRFCLSRRQPAAARRRTRDALVRGLADYALGAGITTYTGVAELAWLQQILAFGWDCRPLGPPAPRDGRMLGALAIKIDHRTSALLAANGIAADSPTPARRAA